MTCQASDFPLPESEAGWVRLSRPGQVHVPWVCCWSRGTSVKKDAALIGGAAGRYVSVGTSPRGGKVWNNGRASQVGTQHCLGGVLAWKKYLWETYSEENGLSETQAVNSVLRSVNRAPDWCAVVWDLLLESWNSRLRRGPCGVGPGYRGGELRSAGAWGWVAM